MFWGLMQRQAQYAGIALGIANTLDGFLGLKYKVIV